MTTMHHPALSRPRSTLPALLLAGAALLAPPSAQADASPADGASPAAGAARIRPLVGLLVTGTLSADEVTLANPDGSNAHGTLGGRIEVLAGAEFPIADNGLALRLTLGMHTGNMSGSGGSERLVRFPLEASLMYPVNPQLRLGAGARYPARLRFTGAGRDTSDGIGATPGIMFLADYALLHNLQLNLRYVYERYETPSGSDLDGSHFGAGMTAIW